MPGSSDPRGDGPDPSWGKFVGLGLEMAVGVGLGYAVGYWLDQRYGWSPKGVLVGTMLGLAGGMYLLIRTALRMNADPPKGGGTEMRNEDRTGGRTPGP